MIKVVLADDEKKVASLLQRLIDWQAMGFEIVGVANDGFRALELIEEQHPELLVTDIRMPGCDGMELIRRARAGNPQLHMVIISGYRQFEYAQGALKYGVEDYLLKPIKQDELSAILHRVKDKLGEESALAYRQKKSDEQQQSLLLSALIDAAESENPFENAETIRTEFGLSLGEGCCFAAMIQPDIPYASQNTDGYRLLQQHTLDIVRHELAALTDTSAAAIAREGIAAVIGLPEYRPMEVRQCLTKIRAEVEKQRDLFWDIRCTVCLGSRQTAAEQLSRSMREALWLCRDRLCTKQNLRDAETEPPDFVHRYSMSAAQKKNLQEAAEYLDGERFDEALEDSFHELRSDRGLNGQIAADWFTQVAEAGRYGMQQTGPISPQFFEELSRRFLRCGSLQDAFLLLRQELGQKLDQLKQEKNQQEMRPITEAKRYMQQHYQEPLRLEDVSREVGFNATYFSVLFKKETGQNFLDYLTELRISKSKELLCRDDLSVQDVAELVGYSDLKYFSRLFKKFTRVSPSDYKKLYR